MVAEKIETLVVFMEGKKKMKPPGAQAVPFSASGGISSRRPVVGASRGRKGHILGTRWFHFFFTSMNTTKVSIFSATIFVNTTQNSNNNQ